MIPDNMYWFLTRGCSKVRSNSEWNVTCHTNNKTSNTNDETRCKSHDEYTMEGSRKEPTGEQYPKKNLGTRTRTITSSLKIKEGQTGVAKKRIENSGLIINFCVKDEGCRKNRIVYQRRESSRVAIDMNRIPQNMNSHAQGDSAEKR